MEIFKAIFTSGVNQQSTLIEADNSLEALQKAKENIPADIGSSILDIEIWISKVENEDNILQHTSIER